MNKALKGLLLASLSFLLGSMTLVLGAAPLHIWRKNAGRLSYVAFAGAMVMVASFIQWPLAIAMGLLALVIFLFNEMENLGYSPRVSFFISLFASYGTGYLGLKFWTMKSGITLTELFTPMVTQFIGQMKTVDSAIKWTEQDLLHQIPSGVFIALTVSLVLALFFEKRLSELFRFPEPKSRFPEFLKFSVPESFIWLVLVSLLAAFVDANLPAAVRMTGVNLLNVLMVFYFLQGMAVISQFFETYKMNPLWRILCYVLLITQLFVFVSCVGLVDYWMDFRQRLKKKTAPTKMNDNKGGWT